MKKFIFLALILTVLVGPGIIGYKLEERAAPYIAQVNDAPIKMGYAHYDRGWFKTTVTLEVFNKSNENFKETFEVYHGPIIFKDGIQFGLLYSSFWTPYGDFEQELENAPRELGKFRLTDTERPDVEAAVLVGYTQAIKVKLVIPSFKLRSPMGSFEFKGIRLTEWSDQATVEQTFRQSFMIKPSQ